MEPYRSQFEPSESVVAAAREQVEIVTGERISFPLSRTVVFLPPDIATDLRLACEQFLQHVNNWSFREGARRQVPEAMDFGRPLAPLQVSCFDFAFAYNDQDEIRPTLLECQGHASLYGVIPYYAWLLAQHMNGTYLTPFLQPYGNWDEYLDDARQLIGDCVTADIDPHAQKFRTDFWILDHFLGAKTRDFHHTKPGVPLHTRVVPTEALAKNMRQEFLDYLDRHEGDFVNDPRWYWALSKRSLPELASLSGLVPKTAFLRDEETVRHWMTSPNPFILKPADDFGGGGVKLNPTTTDVMNALRAQETYILQEKMRLAPAVHPRRSEHPLFLEVRVLCLGEKAVTTLCRLAHQPMINVGFNADNPWCGMTAGLIPLS